MHVIVTATGSSASSNGTTGPGCCSQMRQLQPMNPSQWSTSWPKAKSASMAWTIPSAASTWSTGIRTRTPHEREQWAADVRAKPSADPTEEFLPEALRRTPMPPLNKRTGRNRSE